MAISTMYPAKAGSPQTVLTEELTAAGTSMTVYDASVLPAAPNLAVLGDDSNAEVVSYSAITGNVVSGLVRGLGGTIPSVWPVDTDVARNYTSFDHDRFIENIQDLSDNKLESVSWGDIGGDLEDQTDLVDALAEKQDELTFDSEPTSLSDNPVTSDGIYTALSTKQNTLVDSGWLEHTHTNFSGKIYYRKIGKVVEMMAFQITLATALTGLNVSFGYIPSGYRPDSHEAIVICGSRAGWGQITIATNGLIYFYKPASVTSWDTTMNINFATMYIS